MAYSYFNPGTPDIAIKSLFKKYDNDNSGFLDRKELSSLLADDLGLTPRRVEVYYHLLDKDGNAKISSDELCAWLRSNERFNTLNDKSRFYAICKAVDLFRKYDKDGSQYISCEELKILLIEHGYNVDVKSAFNEIDQDGNGKISFPVFLKWLNAVKLNWQLLQFLHFLIEREIYISMNYSYAHIHLVTQKSIHDIWKKNTAFFVLNKKVLIQFYPNEGRMKGEFTIIKPLTHIVHIVFKVLINISDITWN